MNQTQQNFNPWQMKELRDSQLKPGWRTSEFWLPAVFTAVYVLQMLGFDIGGAESTSDLRAIAHEIVPAIIALLGTNGYAKSRTEVKRAVTDAQRAAAAQPQ